MIPTTPMARNPDAAAYPTITTPSPSHRARRYELRLSGRASIAWAMPLSRSVAIAGEPKKAAVMTSTNPNMKAMKIRTWDTANLTSSSVTPLSRAEAIRLETPHAVSETAIAARMTRTHSTRRLAASPIVSLAMVSIESAALTARRPGRRPVRRDQLEEALLERAPAGSDLLDPRAHR